MTATCGTPVLVVDDHELVRAALVVALNERGFAAESSGPTALLGRLREPAPPGGLVLLDLDLGDGLDGAGLVPALRRCGWRIVVVTGSLDEARIAGAMAAGAAGWIPKTTSMDELVAHVRRAAEGRSLVDDVERRRFGELARVARRDERDLDERWGRLTARERDVAERLARGMRPATIAEEFVVSVGTVRVQVRSILAKLEVSSQLEAAALARRRTGSAR